jgi:hypothetical protein|tara:strand:- start:4480 stop:4860 length:381 start_codon:yes stop_codon:yes gene_type:complete
MNKTEHHKKAMLEALEKTLGIVTTACNTTGIGRTTFYGWLKDDEEFAKKVEEINDIALDYAESQLHKQMGKGSTAATIFYLKTKGKKRGYIERQEFDINNNTAPDLSDMTTDEIKLLLNEETIIEE